MSKQGPAMQTSFKDKSALTCLPTLFLQLSQTLKKSSWNSISTNKTETFPVQSGSYSYGLISIFTNQSEQLYTTNHDSAFWTN